MTTNYTTKIRDPHKTTQANISSFAPRTQHTMQQSNVNINIDIPLSVVELGPNCYSLISLGLTGNTPVTWKPARTFLDVSTVSQAGLKTSNHSAFESFFPA